MKAIHRIMQFVRSKGMSVRRFDISIGAANGYTLRMEKNNASVGSDVLEKIHETYPELNLEWIITGEGEMYHKKVRDTQIIGEKDLEKLISLKLNEKLDSERLKILKQLKNELKKP
ncbi:MAG: hypothetical protein HKN00_09025 [Flavobacteriaceae bacterium]|nr:hypothetical protein [Flavobacteriaceae bacterium]